MPGAAALVQPARTVPLRMALWAGTWGLLRLNVRRDRIRLILWPLAIASIAVAVARAWDALYPTAAGREQLGVTIAATPSLTALLGPLWDPISTGGLTAWRSMAAVVFVIGLVNVFTVVRHTRAEEALGRAEFLRAGLTGRLAIPTSGLKVAFILDLVIGVAATVALVAWGLPRDGAAMYGATVALCSGVFAAVALIAAQLAASSRVANGSAAILLGASLVLAALGNLEAADGGAAVWFSPIGWAQQAQAFAANRAEVLLLPVVAIILLSLIGLGLGARRDLGASQWPSRPGHESASGWINGPIRFAWRLDRSWVAAWLIGVAILGFFVGGLLTAAADVVEGNPAIVDFLAALGGSDNVAEAFGVAMVNFVALAVAGFGISTVLRLRAEEAEGRAEVLLARAVPRVAWASGHISSAFIGAAAILVVSGTTIGISYGSRVDDPIGQAGQWAVAALVPLIAPYVVIAFTVLLIGVAPRVAAPVAWTGLGLCVLMATLGEVLDLPQWVMDASPFTHVPLWPSVPMAWLPIVVMGAVALTFSAVGLAALRGRDMPR
jgi:ABC-2 type transport system permease protein